MNTTPDWQLMVCCIAVAAKNQPVCAHACVRVCERESERERMKIVASKPKYQSES